jgi:hypothetical protein
MRTNRGEAEAVVRESRPPEARHRLSPTSAIRRQRNAWSTWRYAASVASICWSTVPRSA